MLRYTLKKKEVLSKKKEIKELFSNGKSVFMYPLKMVYMVRERDGLKTNKVLFSVTVPKRNIKKAVNRNLVKRRIREAYRLNKHILQSYVPEDKQLIMMFVFVGKQPEKYDFILKAMLNIFSKFK